MRCSTMRTVVCVRGGSGRSAPSSPASSTAIPAVGSSSSTMAGLPPSRIAKSSLRFSPCEAMRRSLRRDARAQPGEHGAGALERGAFAFGQAPQRARTAEVGLGGEPRFRWSSAHRTPTRLKRSPSRAGRARRRGADVVRPEHHATGGRQRDAGEQVEEGRLAGAVRSDDREEFTGLHGERDVVDDRHAADAQAQALGDEHLFEGLHRRRGRTRGQRA